MATRKRKPNSGGDAIVPEKRLAALIRAIDALAEAEQKYLDGDITYAQYAKATDLVIKEKEKLGDKWNMIKVTRRSDD